MNTPILYSTNPWIAHDIAMKYRGGVHFVWCSEYFDPSTAPDRSAASCIAPSSSPKSIYDSLYNDHYREDTHSSLINGYKKTFSRLAKGWLADKEITKEEHDEILAVIRSKSWRIWRPVLYVIPSEKLISENRVKSVQRRERAGYGPEMQIQDLLRKEFDIIETKP